MFYGRRYVFGFYKRTRRFFYRRRFILYLRPVLFYTAKITAEELKQYLRIFRFCNERL